MQSDNSYIKQFGHILEKIKTLRCTPDNAILVTTDVVGLCPNIQACLFILKEALDKKLFSKDTYWRLDQDDRICVK